MGWLPHGSFRVVTPEAVVLFDANLQSVSSCPMPARAEHGLQANWLSRDAEWLALIDVDGRPVLLHAKDCSLRHVPFSPKAFPSGVTVFSVDGDGRRYGLSSPGRFEIHDIRDDHWITTRVPWGRTPSGCTLTVNGTILSLAAAYECETGAPCWLEGPLEVEGAEIVDLASRRRVSFEKPSEVLVWSSAASRDARYVAYIGSHSRDLALVSAKTGHELDRLTLEASPLEDVPSVIKFAPEGDRVAVLTSSGVIVVGLEHDRWQLRGTAVR